jgi:hypothetical protein
VCSELPNFLSRIPETRGSPRRAHAGDERLASARCKETVPPRRRGLRNKTKIHTGIPNPKMKPHTLTSQTPVVVVILCLLGFRGPTCMHAWPRSQPHRTPPTPNRPTPPPIHFPPYNLKTCAVVAAVLRCCAVLLRLLLLQQPQPPSDLVAFLCVNRYVCVYIYIYIYI